MIAKCPKCRFRFEVAVSPGITALKCNCPRCGTPFAVTVDENTPTTPRLAANSDEESFSQFAEPIVDAADGNTVADENVHSKSYGRADDVGTISRQSANGGAGANVNQSDDNAKERFRTKRNIADNPLFVPSHPDDAKAIRRGLTKAAVIMCVIGLLAWAVKGCSDGSDKVEERHNNTAEMTDSITNFAAEPPADVREEPLPKWALGRWEFNTEFGKIKVHITRNMISETSGGETLEGKYRYIPPYIYGSFGENSRFVYRVVEETKQIDCGENMLMSKK